MESRLLSGRELAKAVGRTIPRAPHTKLGESIQILNARAELQAELAQSQHSRAVTEITGYPDVLKEIPKQHVLAFQRVKNTIAKLEDQMRWVERDVQTKVDDIRTSIAQCAMVINNAPEDDAPESEKQEYEVTKGLMLDESHKLQFQLEAVERELEAWQSLDKQNEFLLQTFQSEGAIEGETKNTRETD